MTKLNFTTKSQLAKLLATENIIVEQNQVKTASFDTLNRILTIPIFKFESGDVYDMLIAHEVSHALYTPADGWKKVEDDELRSYVNVLEDTRIDRLIQKKYPGVITNYLNGFTILNKKNFFGVKDKNINTDLMLIDKINLRSKSTNRLPFKFTDEEQTWLNKVDKLKTFKQVVGLAKDMLDWQKKKLEDMKKLPDFDEHVISKNYDLEQGPSAGQGDGEGKEVDKQKDISQGKEESSDNSDKPAVGDKTVKEDGRVGGQNVPEGGGEKTDKLSAITDKAFESQKQTLYDGDKKYSYVSLPKPKLKNIIVYNNEFRDMYRKFIRKEIKGNVGNEWYYQELKKDFSKHKNEMKKTVMYLVKEFEMKKSATAYKRASTDKTGVIDPLKLKNYKFSDDIFKRLTILPNEKNHGMMMLLDWSGSMQDCIMKTVDQLLNLVWFCQKIRIPYDVYFFTSEMERDDFPRRSTFSSVQRASREKNTAFEFQHGSLNLDHVRLVNIANHKMKTKDVDESLMYMYSMAQYFGERYTWSYNAGSQHYSKNHFGIPSEFWLGSTPLNEALVAFSEMVPQFKNTYRVEKMTLITLTDGGANSSNGKWQQSSDGWNIEDTYSGDMVLKHNGKYYKPDEKEKLYSSGKLTTHMLNVMKTEHNVNTIGFYILKRIRGWDGEKYFPSYDKNTEKRKKQFTKDKVVTYKEPGYNQFFVVNGKNMDIQNTDLNDINPNLKTGKIKQLFSKSMKGRITSRVLLNKFIEQVA